MDPKDPSLDGEIAETPIVSQTEITTPESRIDVNSQGASNELSPEEVAFNNLKGGTQDRIRELIKERDEAQAEARRFETYIMSQNQPTYQAPAFNPQAPEVADAVQKLSNVGIATDEKVEKLVNQRVGNLIYNFELRDLEKAHNGSDGLPKFDRVEYEDFVKRNPQFQNYTPEDVYSMKMYPEEIMDARVKSHKGTGQSTTSSLRPTPTVVREDSLTPEFIEKRLQQPDGRKWYAENKDRINSTLATQQTSAE